MCLTGVCGAGALAKVAAEPETIDLTDSPAFPSALPHSLAPPAASVRAVPQPSVTAATATASTVSVTVTLGKLTVKELKARLKAAGLPLSGAKAALVHRLAAAGGEPGSNCAAAAHTMWGGAGGRVGSAIVYLPSRKLTEEMAETLKKRGVSAEAYHAGLPRSRLTDVHRRFLDGSYVPAMRMFRT